MMKLMHRDVYQCSATASRLATLIRNMSILGNLKRYFVRQAWGAWR